MTWNDHDHRDEYAEARHDHFGDYAEPRHDHHDLERAGEAAQQDIQHLRAQVQELRAELASALERISDLEKQTPQARQLQLEADLAAADLAESGYNRHGRDCQCPFCYYDLEDDETEPTPDALIAQAEIAAADAARRIVAEPGQPTHELSGRPASDEKPADICPETSDGYHCFHRQEGVSRCCACGSEPDDDQAGEPGFPLIPPGQIDAEVATDVRRLTGKDSS